MKALDEVLLSVRSDSLKPVAQAFRANAQRLRNLAVSLAEIAKEARVDASWLFYAEFLITGKVSKPFTPEVESVPDSVYEKFNELRLQFDSALNQDGRGILVQKTGVSLVEAMLEDTHGMVPAMESLLSSMVIGYWSVFESLAPDLWKAAINNGPKELSQRVNLASQQEKPDAKIAKHWEDNLKHDPRKDYAGALIESGRVSFRTLEKIAMWYAVTFKDEARKIFKNNPDIYAVAAYRNAFVHNSGMADKDFIKQIEPVDDLRGKFKETDILELDGDLVARLRDSTYSIGAQLIQLADNTLTPITT